MLKKLLLPFLFIAFFANVAFAQTGTITGTVTNKKGDPVPTANVLLVEINRGAATNLQGKYTIKNVKPGTYTLRVSFVGYKDYTTQVTIEAGQTLTQDVTLKKGAVGLEELVVTAFNISREERSLGYQAESVSAQELNAAQPTTAAASLVGKVAGLQINNTGGGVESQPQIILRGMRSVTGNNEALVVIDGAIAPQSAFKALNPSSIKNINVLKGATAAALYGSDASNGVLVVTTKDGKQKAEFTAGYTHSSSWSEIKYVPDHQTEFGIGWDGDYVPYENTNWGPRLTGELRQIGRDYDSLVDYDYPLETQKVPHSYVEDQLLKFFNTGTTQQNTIYLSGGGESSSFYLSLGNVNTKGVIPHDEYSKKTITANAMKMLGDVTLKVNTTYMHDSKNIVGSINGVAGPIGEGHQVGGQIGAQGRAMYWSLLNTPINIPLASYSNWQDPNSYGNPHNYYNAYYQNPYAAIGMNRTTNESNNLRANVSASWDVVDNISITGRLGLVSTWSSGKAWSEELIYDMGLQPAQTNITSNVTDFGRKSSLVTGNVIATGDFKLTEDIGLKANVGASVKMRERRESYMFGQNLSIPGFFEISNATGEVQSDVYREQYRTYGFFGSFTFDYQEWLYLTLTGRQDFTSTLPEGDRAYFYPGAGLSVILSDAIPAIGDLSFLSTLKVTANYSVVYNDLEPYAVNEVFVQPSGYPFPFGSINAFVLDDLTVDSEIQKEKLTTAEFGLNTAFLGSRITFDAAYYLTTTTNLITKVSTSSAAGATDYLTNIGKLSSQGLELSLGADVISTQDITWNVGVNFAASIKQTIEEIKPGINELAMETGSGWGIYAIKGVVFPQLQAVSYKRDKQGRVIVDPETGNPVIGDLKPMGRTTPEYTMGINTSFHYQGFTVSATMDYQANYVYYARGFDFMEFTGRSVRSAAANRQNFVWPNSSIPDPNGKGYIANTNIPISGGIGPFWRNHYNQIKENYVRDATAFRLRNASISYSLPTAWLSKTGVIRRFTVSLYGRNLLTIRRSDETVFSDPEFGAGDNAIGYGGYLTAPPQRTYGFSVNIEF